MNSLTFLWIIVTWWIVAHPGPASSCGGLQTGRKGEIKTPNFPIDYGNNVDCTWTIRVGNGETIVIEFLQFYVEKSILSGVDCSDTFSVYDGPESASRQLIDTPCGYTIPGPLYSSRNILTLNFISDERNVYIYYGVHLKWKGIDLIKNEFLKVSDKFTLYKEPKKWEEANSACLNEGGHLAVKSDLNTQLMINLIGDRSDSLWIGEYYTPWIWLQGCYKDQDLNLTSSKRFVETKENEAKVCQHHCLDTVYFGMKGIECYCLTTEDMDRLVFARSFIECDTPCSGNDKERCGGAFSLTVYMNDVCWENSSTWVTKISRTISGKSCQAWSSDFPHAHAFHGDDMFPDGNETLASNYCRDPDGKGAPWCFTTDPNMPWQFCDAPPCPGTCWGDPTEYSGHLNVSVHGHKCTNWADEPPSKYMYIHDASQYPDSTVSKASNYCRSPNGYPSLWCLIGGDRWDSCGAPPCFDSATEEEIGELCRVFWTQGSKFYFKQHDCAEGEYYSCFVDETESKFVAPDKMDTHNDSFVQHAFYNARDQCRSRYMYALSNYKNLFGLSDYVKLGKDINGSRPKHWLGNMRGEDTTSYEKGDVLKPSACKTTRNSHGYLKTEIQSNCDLRLGFICHKDALLCGDTFYNDSGTISSPGYPDNYDDNEYCEWQIHVAEGRTIDILFHDVDVEFSKTCSFDYIEMNEVHMNSSQRIGQKLCGELSNVSKVSETNHVIIKFRSDKDVHRKGFNLEWTSVLLPTTTSISKTSPEIVTDHLIDGAPETDESKLSSSTLTGIIIGVVLALVVAVVILLVIFVLRRKKQQKTGAETIMQLKALESTSAASTPTNAETPQKNVHSSQKKMTYANVDHETEVHIEGDTYYNVSDKKSDEHDGSDQHFYEMDDSGQAYEKLSSGKQVEQMYTPLNPNLI